jgi:hypothetical protein
MFFSVRPNFRGPGFNVREPEEEVPGFRLNADGTVGKASPPAAKVGGNPFDIFEPQPSGVWPPPYLALAGGVGAAPGNITRGAFLDDIKELPGAIGDRLGAMANGAYSVFPGVYNAGRAAARGLGLLGPEEAERFRRELELIRSSANAIVDRPADAARAAYYGADGRFGDPLLKWHLLGRGAMGYLARVGPVPLAPVALVGDTLRAFENGRQNLIDALLDGIQGER